MNDQANAIEKLKELTIQKNADFSEAANFFLDIAEDPKLLSDSQSYDKNNKFFEDLLKPVAQHCGAHVKVSALYLMKVDPLNFVHGVAQLSNRMAVTLYFFENIQTGMAIISLLGGQTNFFRLTAKLVQLNQDSSIYH